MPATSSSQVQRLPPLQCHPEGLSPELCDLAGYWEETPATEVTFHQSSQSLRGSEGNEIDREFLCESSRGPLRKGTCLGLPAWKSEQQRSCWILGTWFRPFLAADLRHTAYLSPAR